MVFGRNKKPARLVPARVRFLRGSSRCRATSSLDSGFPCRAGVRQIMAMAVAMALGMDMVMSVHVQDDSKGDRGSQVDITVLEVGQVFQDLEGKVDFSEGCVDLNALEFLPKASQVSRAMAIPSWTG